MLKSSKLLSAFVLGSSVLVVGCGPKTHMVDNQLSTTPTRTKGYLSEDINLSPKVGSQQSVNTPGSESPGANKKFLPIDRGLSTQH